MARAQIPWWKVMAVGGYVAGWLAKALADGRVSRREVDELFFGVLDIAGFTGEIDILEDTGKYEDHGLTPGPVPIPGPLDPPRPYQTAEVTGSGPDRERKPERRR